MTKRRSHPFALLVALLCLLAAYALADAPERLPAPPQQGTLPR